MTPNDSNFKALLTKLQAAGKLPAGLSQSQISILEQSFSKWTDQVNERVIQKVLADWQDKIKAAQTLEQPAAQRGALYDLAQFISSDEVRSGIEFALKISQEVASGAGQYLNQNLSPEVLDEYPALEFKRLFERNVPRGLKVGKKGTLIPVPDENWPTRWAAAAATLRQAQGDEDWLDWEGDPQTGRGVALKSSGIWQALGDGAGGYDDTLGNPFMPFAFNSGFGTLDLGRNEAVKLGLIGAQEQARPAAIDFGKLFAEVAE